ASSLPANPFPLPLLLFFSVRAARCSPLFPYTTLFRSWPACKDHVERTALANNAGQTHRSASNKRHPPTAAEHAKHGIFFSHTQIAHQGQLKPTCHGITHHCSNHRFR